MKLFRLTFLLGCCLLINAFQINAQCSITNLSITSINCEANAFTAANTDYTICGSFTATSTSGNYEFASFHQANFPVTETVMGLAKDGVINFCVIILDVSYIPEGFTVAEQGSMTCSASAAGAPPVVCSARPACNLNGLSISNVCCDGSGGLRVIGNFTATNGSGNYRLQVDGVPDPFGFPGVGQMINLPAAGMNGTINFDITFPGFDYSNIGSGIYIADNTLSCSTPAGQMPPTSAAACTSCPTPTDYSGGIEISDPCSCADPKNIKNANGDIIFFHDILRVVAGPSEAVTLTANSGVFLSNSTTPTAVAPSTIIGTTNAAGVLEVEFFHADGVAGNISISTPSGTGNFAVSACFNNSCKTPIPTMSQWGLIIFGLLVLNLGIIFLYKKQSQFIK